MMSMNNSHFEERLTRWGAANRVSDEIASQIRLELLQHKAMFLRELKKAFLDPQIDPYQFSDFAAMYLKKDQEVIDLFNTLLLEPQHTQHQLVTKTIQELRSPSSVPYLRRALEGTFDHLAYTCSDDDVIAKWFSWALHDIGTPEALAVLQEFSVSPNPEIAAEMTYRLRKFEQRHK